MKYLVRVAVILAVAALATLQARASVLVNEQFNYTDGNLTTQSGGTWATYSGTGTDIQVVSGQAVIDSHNAPDDGISLGGGDYTHGVLYAGFDVNFNAEPTGSGTYFGLFKDASTFNFFARVWASNDVSLANNVKIGIANQSGTAHYDGDLTIGTTYRIVVMLDNTGALPVGSLWVNPVLESDAHIVGTDTPTIANPNITQWGLREGTASFGTFENVDNLIIGTTFADVATIPEPSTIMLIGMSLVGLFAIRRRRS